MGDSLILKYDYVVFRMRSMLQFGSLLKDMYVVPKMAPRATLLLKAGQSWRLPWIADAYALQ